MTERTQPQGAFVSGSTVNVLDFLIRSIVKGMVNTAIPVRVDSVTRPGSGGGAGYLSATPLVKMRSSSGEALEPVSIPKLRWFRLQHGTAAIVCDPKPGDVGLAVFAQQDVSTLTGGNTPQQPGSFRCYDMSDGFYFGGFWGPTPTTFVQIEDSGDITITAPQTVTINTNATTINADSSCTINTIDAQVKASGSTTIDSPATHVTGSLRVDGLITGLGGMAISGGSGASVTGNITVESGDVSADGIGLKTHTHTCPQGGETSEANG